MILECKFQLDEMAWEQEQEAWLTKTGVGRTEIDEGPRKTGIRGQRTAFAEV